ncbi:MAG: ADP-ribosylglycohydrolase [Myxococcota bacterium]|jgi:ADP-ribosylglycohydrolase
MSTSAPTAEQIVDAYLGIALGDAVGMGCEGQDRRKLWAALPVLSSYVSFRAPEHAVGYRLGDYSDDTADSLGTTMAIISDRELSAPLLVAFWRAEWKRSFAARGGVPRCGYGPLGAYFEGDNPVFATLDDVRSFQAARTYPGNAPAMRAVPIGLLLREDRIDEVAQLSADATHDHPIGRAASAAVAWAAHHLLVCGGDPAQTIAAVLPRVAAHSPHVADYLRRVDDLPDLLPGGPGGGVDATDARFEVLLGPQPTSSFMQPEPIYGLPGNAMYTAGAILYIATHATSTADALRRAVYMGGDTDSLAAPAVGLCAGRFGLGDVPEALLAGLEGRDRIADIARSAAQWRQGSD